MAESTARKVIISFQISLFLNLLLSVYGASGTYGTSGHTANAIYTSLLLGGKLNNYLTEVDRQAEELFLRLVNQMAAQESISEQLKVENQMEWVRRMNSVRARTEEIIYVALIYR